VAGGDGVVVGELATVTVVGATVSTAVVGTVGATGGELGGPTVSAVAEGIAWLDDVVQALSATAMIAIIVGSLLVRRSTSAAVVRRTSSLDRCLGLVTSPTVAMPSRRCEILRARHSIGDERRCGCGRGGWPGQ